ncbi:MULTISPECIES: adenosine deaminase [unclassified Kocuria]|uniref:adenosine deaminase n=1 Tax=unclassified Kocuria TaxID=2649579 RepID=UPI00064B4159|nr:MULTISPECIES: adenosine deaminase [unclassified Kocuria]KLU08860.1 adenine deaminase [Kocuria sp. SM24M-10]OLT09558.1 adenosine deaminase [Kocuria sp. CNJ-770]
MKDLYTLPKAELHLHIEGTLEPELAFELAARNGVELPYASVEELRRQYDFEDLSSFLELYYATMAVLREASDFEALTRAYLERAAGQGLRHVDVFFDPQAHTARGVPLAAVVDGIRAGLDAARAQHGITSTLLLCFLRDRPAAEALAMFDGLGDQLARIDGIGLDSAEVGHPPALFEEVYARARDAGLHVVAHAGEEAGPEYVREALDVLRVERVDHGIQCLQDPRLVERLVAERVPLTVCPQSNVRLRVVRTLAEHPVLEMLERGLVVTVNSDDPAYFGGYVGDAFQGLREALGLTDEQAAALARNAVDASFAGAPRKREMHEEIRAWERG